MSHLVVGELSPFVSSIANKLNDEDKVNLLISTVKDSNKSWLNKNVNVYYGSPYNEELVSKILDEQNVSKMIYIPSGLGQVIVDKGTIVENAREQLLGITHFLDGWRKSKDFGQKTLIYISSLDVYGNAKNPNNKTNLKPSTELGAALTASEAILHSYAVSYKLNIKILRLRTSEPPKNIEDILIAVNLLKNHDEGVAKIFHMPSDTSADMSDEYVDNLTSIRGYKDVSGDSNWLNHEISKVFVPAVRFLVYGSKGWIGEQFVELLKNKGIECIPSSTKPGIDTDSTVADEITKVSPSHVVSMLGRTHGPGCGNIEYLEGGPDKLNENVCDNLYAPWILANLCQKFNLHFTYVGTGCLFEYNSEHKRDGKGYTESDVPNFIGNKYSVVKGFTDQSLTFFKNTLNARIRLPINNENSSRNLLKKVIGFKQIIDIPNNITYLPDCLPILLDLALQHETGTINLVNPGSITLPKILEIYQEETGNKLDFTINHIDENSKQNRAHCLLDTTRLQTLIPGVLDSVSAVRRAIEKLS